MTVLDCASSGGTGHGLPEVSGVCLQLQAHGRVVRPYIGIKMLQLDAAKADQLRRTDGAFPAVRAGILVPQVLPGSPAHSAGLQPGDVIVGEHCAP